MLQSIAMPSYQRRLSKIATRNHPALPNPSGLPFSIPAISSRQSLPDCSALRSTCRQNAGSRAMVVLSLPMPICLRSMRNKPISNPIETMPKLLIYLLIYLHTCLSNYLINQAFI
jgi:hypothetical protein